MTQVGDGEVPGIGSEARNEALDEIAAFIRLNTDFRELVRLVGRCPSVRYIGSVTKIGDTVTHSAAFFFENEFFRQSGDEALVRASVGSCIAETEAMWELATEIRPEAPTDTKFGTDFETRVMTALLHPEEFDGVVGENGEEESAHDRAYRAVTTLCDTYSSSVTNVIEKFMSSESILEFNLAELEREERSRKLETAGIVAAAAFLGTLGAQWASKRLGLKND